MIVDLGQIKILSASSNKIAENLHPRIMDEENIKKKIEIFLAEIEKCLRSIKPIVDKKLIDTKWTKKLNVPYPILNQPEHKSNDTPFEFHPPIRFDVIGDYRLNISTSVVHLAVEIPEKTIGQRDYLNHTYHQKRALILMIFASNLRNLKSVKSLEFVLNDDEPLRPILRLVPSGILLNRTEVLILPYPPKNVWKLKRFLPSMSNVRLSWYFRMEKDKNLISNHRSISADGSSKKNSKARRRRKTSVNENSHKSEQESLTNENMHPTPNYNHCILNDILLVDFTDRTLKDFGESLTLREGISLITTWLRLRGLYDEFSNVFSSNFVNNFVRYLLKIKRITTQTNSYQIFRAFALAFSQNLLDAGISLEDGEDKMKHLNEFRKYFPFAFLDSTGCFNFCSHLDELTYSRLKHEASLAIQILDQNEFDDAFSMLFVDQVPFCKKYDQFITIKLDKSLVSNFERDSTTLGSLVDVAGGKRRLLMERIVEILKKALALRILSIEILKSDKISKWKIDDESPPAESNILTFGVLVNPETYNNPLEKGPSADSLAASEFRSFWGEKSEMRKFSDTSVCEAVVWHGENQMKKRSVLSQIVKFVLQRHLNIQPTCVKFIVGPLDLVITAPFLKGTGEEENFSLNETYERISQSIRLLDGLPLTVIRVFSTEPSLRQTEVLPVLPVLPSATNKSLIYTHDECMVPRPGAFVAPPWCQSLEVQITLESSGKWPDDVEAVGKLKMAFLIKIVELLKQQFQIFAVARDSCALIFQNGYVFRLILVYPREVTLLKIQTIDGGLIRTKNTEASTSLDKLINRRPTLCSFLSGISQQHPSFGLTCRLIKRWISSHLLSGYVSDEALELIVAHVYLSPFPYTTPGYRSSIVAFIRSLTILATYDWLKNPLIVNLNNQLNKQEIAEIRSEFVKLRPTLPPLCIVTPDDRLGVFWTRPQPNAMITERLINLARCSLDALEKNLLLMSDLKFDPKIVFRTPLDVFDVLIHLLERQMPRRFMSVDEQDEFFPPTPTKVKRKKTPTKEVLPVIDYDPVEIFVGELKTTYDDVAMIFYDKYGGNVVGFLWKPEDLSSTENGVSSTQKSKNSKNKNLKREEIIENIEILGKGLVKNVEILKS